MSSDTRAKRYAAVRYSLSLFETGCLFLLLFLFARLGWSAQLYRAASAVGGGPFIALALYVLSLSVFLYIALFPLTFYHSFLLERQFALSTQSVKDWAFDQLKSASLTYVLSLFLLAVFYWAVRSFPDRWWMIVSFLWIAFNIILLRLAPVFIVPLFFTYKPVTDRMLRDRILRLAEKMKLGVTGVYEIDMSRKTIKANAGLMGWGGSRRIILGDTLGKKYTPDEVEVILAHEFAHQKLHHLPKLMLLNALTSAATFYAMFATGPAAAALSGVAGLGYVEGLPLAMMYFVLCGFCAQPLANFVSRRMERNADITALEVTGSAGAFISAMEKLGAQNLADRDPRRWIKLLFFDHPPIAERVACAEPFLRRRDPAG